MRFGVSELISFCFVYFLFYFAPIVAFILIPLLAAAIIQFRSIWLRILFAIYILIVLAIDYCHWASYYLVIKNYIYF